MGGVTMRRNLDLILAALVAAFLMTFSIVTHGKVRHFPLNRPVVESGTFVCIEKDKAVDLVRALVESGEAASGKLMDSYVRAGLCGQLPQAEFIYKRQVYRGEFDGDPATVFEATIGNVTVYVPMVGWLPDPGV